MTESDLKPICEDLKLTGSYHSPVDEFVKFIK